MSTIRRSVAPSALAAALASTAVALTAGSAVAQNIQKFNPATGTTNFVTVEGAATAPHLTFVPSVWVNYGKNPLVLRKENGAIRQKLVEHLITFNFEGAIGFGDRFELGIDLPMHVIVGNGVTRETDAQGNIVAATDPGFSHDDPSGFGLGDIRLLPKFQFFGPKARRENGFGLAAAMPVTFQTGAEENFVGTNMLTLNPEAIAELRLEILKVAANVGFKWYPENDQVGTLEVGNEVTYGGSAAVALGDPDMWIIGELFGAGSVEQVKSGSKNSPMEAVLAFRAFTGPGVVMTAGLGRGLIPDYGAPQFRAFVGAAYQAERSDRDGDGIIDDEDGCPDEPEDKDDFEDSDGCPDPDNDKDGLVDAVDRCPNEPETRNGFADDDGCPDEVPVEAPPPKPIERDTDGDGLLDSQDKCPNDPEDKDNFEDADGCPDPDNDQDGIPDVSDKCPNEPENVNGVEDEDGCPDQGPSKVRITAEKIEILDKVFFETNKAVIKPVSYDILNQVATVMRHAPDITKLRVEGHTDSQGKDAANMTLSQKRSEAVRAYLIKQGVEPERLEARGFGETVPVADNKTANGRAENRRVEFRIMERIER
jgi:outer membrane protein OmpA-like peptidoglycan-associated protein